MPGVIEPSVLPEITEKEQTKESFEPGYLVICWNDPINTMQYVTHVFQKVFGWNRQLAEKRMLEVHHHGKSILTRESMEKARYYVSQLQSYSLHASMEKDPA